MRCPNEGSIQAYIDGELNDTEIEKIEVHLFQCERCKDVYKELNSSNIFAMGKLQNYKENFNINPKTTINTDIETRNKKGVYNNMKRYKNIAAAACAALVVTTCITVTPIRAAITNAVSIFRVHDIKSVNVSLDDIKQLEKELQEHKSDINIDKIGKVNISGGEQKTLTIDEAKKLLPFSLTAPVKITDKSIENIYVNTPAKADFTLNVENVNQILKSIGEKNLFPKDLNEKTFSLNTAGILNVTYKNPSSNSFVTVTESKIPELIAPDEKDVDEIYNALSNLSILPQDMQMQLKSIKDWRNTLYIPNVGNKSEEMNINGIKAIGRFDTNKGYKNSSVIILKGDVLIAINGNVDKNEMIEIAKSMR